MVGQSSIPSVIDIPGMMHGHRARNGNSSVEVITTGANLLPRYSETGRAEVEV